MESTQKYDLFIDIACPRCGCTMGNGGQGDIFTCPGCGWHGKAEIDPSDIALANQIIREHRERQKQ